MNQAEAGLGLIAVAKLMFAPSISVDFLISFYLETLVDGQKFYPIDSQKLRHAMHALT